MSKLIKQPKLQHLRVACIFLLSLTLTPIFLNLLGCGKLWGGLTRFQSSNSDFADVQLGETARTTYGSGIASDISSNIYISGMTDGYLPSCQGISANCTGAGQGTDYYLSKYNSSGTWQWTTQLGETARTATGTALAADSNLNIYVTGFTNANLASCNGISTSCSGTAQGTQDYFVSKYSSSGNWQWTQQLGETGKTTRLRNITIDPRDKVYVCGDTTGYIPSCGGVSANCSGSSQGAQDYYIRMIQ